MMQQPDELKTRVTHDVKIIEAMSQTSFVVNFVNIFEQDAHDGDSLPDLDCRIEEPESRLRVTGNSEPVFVPQKI